MAISLGPYQRGLPFLTIQDIRFDVNPENEYLLTIGLSNEKIVKTGRRQRDMSFGNFIYFSSDKAEIDAITSDLPTLIEAIKRNPENKHFFNVGEKDFKYKADAEGGGKIYSFFHQKQFKLKQTPTLYVLACIFIERRNNFVIGNITKETILNNNLSPVMANVYSLAETVEAYGSINSVWPGSAHIQNNQVMAGNTHVAAQHPNLSRTGVFNVRLKDLRVVQAARALSFDFTSVPETYFSSLTLSRGQSGAINGSFTFNLFNFAKNNSKLGGLIDNQTSLLASVSIKDIIIYQRIVGRDAKGNSLTPGVSELCGLKEANSFKKVASLKSNCQIVQNVNENQAEYYEIFFLDDTTTEINAGQAEYKAEIILDDNTDKLVVDSISPLKRNLKMISDVKQIADDPAVYDDVIVDYLASVRSIFGNLPFSTFSTLFWRKNLLSLVNQFNPNYDSDKYLFLSIMRDYVSKLEDIVAQYAPSDSKIKNDSKIYRSKKDRLLRAIKEFKEVYQFVGTRSYGFDYVDMSIGQGDKITPSISYNSYSGRAQEEINKYGIVNTQAAVLNPYGFLSPMSINITPNPTRIPTRSLESVPSRPNVATNNTSNTTVNVSNAPPLPASDSTGRTGEAPVPLNRGSTGTISPLTVSPYIANISAGTTTTSDTGDTVVNKPGRESLNDRVLPVIKDNLERQTISSMNKEMLKEDLKRDVLKDLGVSIKPNEVPLKELVKVNKSVCLNLIDAMECLSSTSDFIFETKPTDLASGSVDTKFINKKDPKSDLTKKVFNNVFSNNLIDKTISLNKPSIGITNTEQMQGSPALQKLNEDSSIMYRSSEASNAINFNSVARVHYLDSYDPKKGVAQQNWKLLTEQKYNDAQQRSQALVCKLVKVTDATGTGDLLRMEPMSSLFVLGSPKVTNGISQIKTKDLVRSARQDIGDSAIPVDLNNINILYSKSLPMSSVSPEPTAQQALETNNLGTGLFNTTTIPSSVGY